MQTYTVNRCNVCMKIFKENTWKLVNRKNIKLLYHNARPHSARTKQEKIIGFRRLCSTIFTRRCTKWSLSFSFSTKCSEWQNEFLKIRWKCLGKSSCAQNQLKFTWEESTNNMINGKKWFKIMANILLIDSLENSSWIDYILLKRKLSMNPPNRYP